MPSASSPSAQRPRRLRSRLLLPAATVALCLTGLAIVRAVQLRRAQESLVKADALGTAVASAHAIDETIAGTQALLLSISELVGVASPPERTDSILRHIIAAAPIHYRHLLVVSPEGRILGSANPTPPGRVAPQLLQQPLYHEVMASHAFSVGILQPVDGVKGHALMLPFAMPVLDATRTKVTAIVGASVLFDSLAPVRNMARLPAGSVLSIMDSSGTIVYRSLDPEHWVGRSFRGDTGVANDFRIQSRVGAGQRSADGTVRLVGTSRIARAPWVLYLGIPIEFTLNVTRNAFLRDLAVGAALTLLLLVMGYRSTLRVVTPIESLTADARAIAEGEMTRRSTVASADEVGDLARAFNRMADTIAERDEALRSSQAQLLHAQKMDALGSFAGGIAHDFNNYLHSIIGHTELAAMAVPADSMARQDMREVLAAASRAADLTRQILVFSRKQVVEPRTLDLNAVVRGIERMLIRMLGEERNLALQLAERVLKVHMDEGQLEQVLVNLVANARDATRPGGLITISTDAVPHGTDGAARARIRVQDDGAGMSAEIRNRVFDPFFTTKERRGGTGLGLAIVYGIVEQAAGEITIDSAPDAGTTVSITVPLRSGTVVTPVDVAVIPSSLSGRGLILLAEDNAAVRSSTERMLQNAGYQVVSAADGPSALHQLRSETQPFDVLLTDVVMPGMSGSELAQRVQELQPGIAVLFMSGYADDDTLRAQLANSSAVCIAKPFTSATLVSALHDVQNARPAAAAAR